MKIDYKQESKLWATYFATILIAMFVHEVGHCIPEWVHGYFAVPTLAKEYSSDFTPKDLNQPIALGGILGSVFFTLTILLLYIIKKNRISSSVLAGAIAMPGLYSFMFFIKGRGHDGTEFQDAQSVLGFSYSGHSIEWIFFTLFLVGSIAWYLKTKPGIRIIKRLLIGFVVTVIITSVLQDTNNAIFDPIFLTKSGIGK